MLILIEDFFSVSPYRSETLWAEQMFEMFKGELKIEKNTWNY